jgi:hypothetical protein
VLQPCLYRIDRLVSPAIAQGVKAAGYAAKRVEPVAIEQRTQFERPLGKHPRFQATARINAMLFGKSVTELWTMIRRPAGESFPGAAVITSSIMRRPSAPA